MAKTTHNKLLIDVEKTNNLSGYYIRSKDRKEIETIASGKMIIAITENEHKNKIYKLLEDNCDLIFCTTDKLKNFEFYPVPMLAIFAAADNNGTHFGTIGGMGGLDTVFIKELKLRRYPRHTCDTKPSLAKCLGISN